MAGESTVLGPIGTIISVGFGLFPGRDEDTKARRRAAAQDIARTRALFEGLPSRGQQFGQYFDEELPPPPPEETPGVISAEVLPRNVFIAYRQAIYEWAARKFDSTVDEVARDPRFAEKYGRLLDCMNDNDMPATIEAVEECTDIVADEVRAEERALESAAGKRRIEAGGGRTRGDRSRPGRMPVGGLPGILVPPPVEVPVAPPATMPPGATIPGQPVIRPVVVTPTSPQVTGPEGPISSLPGEMYPDPMPEIRWPDWGELFPQLPQLDEILLLPVKLPTIKRKTAPEKPPKRVLEPAPTVTPTQIPGPVPAPAATPAPPKPRSPARVGLAQVLQAGALVGQLAGLIGRPGPVGQLTIPGGGSTFEPAVPFVPDSLASPFAQGQATRTRDRTKRCEKTRRKNRKTCWTGLYREKRSKTKFEKWYARDCTTGEFLEKTERK